MKVTKIEITRQRFNSTKALHEGLVTLKSVLPHGERAVWVQFLCTTPHKADCARSVVVHGLIEDALRQARRMPGFRRNEEPIEIAAPPPHVASA